MLNKFYRFLFFIFIMMIINIKLYANSAWHYYTNAPYTILFPVIIFTLVFETIFILYLNSIKKIKEIIIGTLVIIIANLTSFLAPYIWLGITLEPASKELENNFYSKMVYIIDIWPNYVVGIGFIIISLMVEIPIVYNVLKKYIDKKVKLIIIIIIVNVISSLVITLFDLIKFKRS